MPLVSTIARLTRVPDALKESMLALHGLYFCNVGRRDFFEDLREKDWVILLRNGRDIAGFSTLKIIRLPVDGVERVFLFSGDTIVDRAHWQDSTLAGSFGHFMLRLMDEQNPTALYWFLITKGYRTYRFLPVYFERFFPAYDRPTPPEYDALLRAIAVHKFGRAYDPTTGLVRFGGRKDRLRPDLCGVTEARRRDPHVRFFLEKNPDYALGDELACIADIRRDNLNKYAWRVIRDTTVHWDE